MHANGAVAQLPFQLSDGFQERGRLDIANSATNLRDDKIDRVVMHDTTFDFIGDMRHHLDGFAEIIAMSFLVDDRLVNFAGSHGVSSGSTDACETFIVAQVEVSFHPVNGHVALAVLVRVECAWVDVDIRVKFLDGDGIAARLQQLSDTG